MFEVSALTAPAMSLPTAIELLPTDKLAFTKARYRWIKVVRGLQMLTTAQRQVGLVIAQNYINNNPENPWFHSAWAAHQTIADQTGLTRRTVITAMVALRQLGLIAIEHGGGLKVPGGRTDRYTLRTDCLDDLERVAQRVRQKDVKIFHGSNCKPGRKLDQSGEKNAESGEIDDQMMRNSPSADVKELHTTLPNETFLGSCSKTYSGSFTTSEPPSLAAIPRAINGRKKAPDAVTAQDHHELALLLGNGDLERGYGRLDGFRDANVNNMALRYRFDRSTGQSIKDEVAKLKSMQGSPK